jgi:hypothetical protein
MADKTRQMVIASHRTRYEQLQKLGLTSCDCKICEALLEMLDGDELEVAVVFDIALTARMHGLQQGLLAHVGDFASEHGLLGPDTPAGTPPEN